MFSSGTSNKATLSMLGWAAYGMFSSMGVQADELSEEQEKAFSFNKVLVSSTRVEAPIGDVSRPVSLIEKDQIDTMQPQSVAQTVRYEPNVTVSGGPRAGNQSVNIRGLEGSKVLQVVDGVRQVFQSGHRPSYFLDPSLLKSVEVVKGPASTLWGSGALGGVVSQNTVSASDLLKADQSLGGFIKAGFNGNNDQQAYVGALAGRTETIDWLLSSYYRDSNDTVLGNGDNLEDSAQRDKGVLAKADLQINEDQALNVSYRQSNENGDIPSNGTVNVNGSSVFLIDRDTDTKNAAIGYDFNPASDLVNSNISGYWNNVDMSESRVSDGRGDHTELDVYGLSLKNVSDLGVFSGLGAVSLFYGVDGYTEDFDARRAGADRPVPPKADTDVWGAYLSANVDITDDFSVELGARYDRFETKAKNLNNKQDDDDVSPSIALIWQANEAIQLTLRHDQAFRAPSSEELYTTGTHFCMGPGFCNSFVSNPDLKSEKAANTELMARLQFEPPTVGGQLYVESSIFENKIDDFIEQIVSSPTFFPVMDPGTTTWVNVDEATIRGFEIATTYIRNELSLKLAYGQSRGKDDKSGQNLTNIPADKITADMSYQWLDRTLVTGLRATNVYEQRNTKYDENTTGETYDAYATADLYASWSPERIEGLKVDLTVNNLSDRHYRQAWQQLYEPGREIIISTQYAF